jgi:EAL domain-containing protein (putative c-di-GMP-specific phosphodiesterase class I)
MVWSLKLRVIAEGVESAEDLAFLKSQHCDEAQGFYLGGPVPAEQFPGLSIMQMN